jgi:hypothetical protein
MEGVLTLRFSSGEALNLKYTLDSELKGQFSYDGVRYTMEYDEYANKIRLTALDDHSELQRKDALAGLNFVDQQGVSYHFDGRSALTTGGILTVDGNTTYTYRANADGWDIYSNSAVIGNLTLSEDKAYYELTINSTVKSLYLSNAFIGNWAIGGEFGMMEIGPTDLNGNIKAVFKGYNVDITTLEPNLLTFKYWEDKMPITYYVFVVEDEVLGYDVLVLSQYSNLYSGDYSICTKAHELYGEWVNGTGEFTLRFDGITSGAYSNGVAELYRGTPSHTDYYYRTESYGITLWSQSLLGNKTQYYKLIMLDVASLTAADKTAMNIYMKKDAHGNILAAFKRVEADGLLFVNAKDTAGNTYFFDGENVNGKPGNLSVNGEVKYTYKVKAYNDDSTATLEITSLADGKTYSATLDYSKSGNYILTIGEIIENGQN